VLIYDNNIGILYETNKKLHFKIHHLLTFCICSPKKGVFLLKGKGKKMTKNKISMPQATATWLIENTTLTFKQIGNFCSIHWLQVKAIADGEIPKVIGQSPVEDGLTTKESIEVAEKDSKKDLLFKEARKDIPTVSERTKGIKYIPISKRDDKPNAIAWLLKNYPELEDQKIVKLIRTTTPTIEAIRMKSHKRQDEIIPQSPVLLGLCSDEDLKLAIDGKK